MGNLREQIVASARSRIGAPFLHHFKPENLCQDGTVTVDECMQQGIDSTGGYDCSGLVVASICDVLGITTNRWPRDWRHLNQMKRIATQLQPEIGDVLVFEQSRGKPEYLSSHLGIFVTKECVIHSSGHTGFVEEGPVEGDYLKISTVHAGALIALASL